MGNVSVVREKATPVILADGSEVELLYTLNSFADLEESYGSIDDALDALETGSIIAIRRIMYYGLVDNKGMTEREFGGLLEFASMDTYGKVLAQAIGGATPEEAEKMIEDAKEEMVEAEEAKN